MMIPRMMMMRISKLSYPYCEDCNCDLKGTTERICDQASDRKVVTQLVTLFSEHRGMFL